MNDLIRLGVFAFLCGCANTRNAPPADGPGPYSLPVSVSPRVVIVDVDKHRYPDEKPFHLTYVIDGQRRTITIEESGDSDGFITYLGRQLRTEKRPKAGEPYDGPIIDEDVIRLATGEEIVIGGNTVLGRRIWIR